jgi:hypothetical protein
VHRVVCVNWTGEYVSRHERDGSALGHFESADLACYGERTPSPLSNTKINGIKLPSLKLVTLPPERARYSLPVY